VPIPSASRLVLVALALVAARSALAVVPFEDSPFLERPTSYSLTCDVTVTPANFTTTLAQLNDSTKHVFCVTPGDYRAAGELFLTISGSQEHRRSIRFDGHDGKRQAIQRPERAIFESLRILGSWWVIQGLTIQPQRGSTAWFVTIYGGDHNILDGNVIDGIDHVPQLSSQNAVVIAALNGNPASFNSVQGNVIRNGNQTRRPGDYGGVVIAWGDTAVEHNDSNKVLDNEIYDWGDGIGVAGHTSDCSEPGIQHGTIIDGNDVYITAAKRIDCDTGALDPNGDCSCAENGIDLKLDPGEGPRVWTRVTNNRLWGFRPTSPSHSCGGSGANGQALSAGNTCSAHVFAANNVILDSTQGIVPNRFWIVAGNLIHETRMSNGLPWTSVAIFPIATASNLVIQFNTVVAVDSAYGNSSENTDTRCNVVILNPGLRGATNGNATNSTQYNYLYQSSLENFSGMNNQIWPLAQQSNDADYCFWRRRWTAPEIVCIPLGSTTSASPHVAAVANCNPSLGRDFGVSRISYPTSQPCNDGLDNDGDGLADWPRDPGCADLSAASEDPQCENGVDDDGDGQIDFDGGAAANGGIPLAPSDGACGSAHSNSEVGSCGLGAELVGVLWVLRRRRAR